MINSACPPSLPHLNFWIWWARRKSAFARPMMSCPRRRASSIQGVQKKPDGAEYWTIRWSLSSGWPEARPGGGDDVSASSDANHAHLPWQCLYLSAVDCGTTKRIDEARNSTALLRREPAELRPKFSPVNRQK